MIYVLVMSGPIHNQEASDLDFQGLCMPIIETFFFFCDDF